MVCSPKSGDNPRALPIGLSLVLEDNQGPVVIKLFSYSPHLLIKLKYQQMKKFLALSISDVLFIILINVKMPTIVGILTFMS